MIERIVCIDPGSETHGLVVLQTLGPKVGANRVEVAKKAATWEDIEWEVSNLAVDLRYGRALVACERVAPGQSSWTLTKTSEIVGRVVQLHHMLTNGHHRAHPLHLLPRREVLRLLRVSGPGAQRDKLVRHCLIGLHGGDRKTAIGTKYHQGPLYGVSSHAWAALAVGVAVRIKLHEERMNARKGEE